MEEALSGFDTQVALGDEGFDASDQWSPYLVAFDEPSVGHCLEHQVESDLVHDAKGTDVHSGGFGPSQIDALRVADTSIEELQGREEDRFEHGIEKIAAVFDGLDDGGLSDFSSQLAQAFEGIGVGIGTGGDIDQGGFPDWDMEMEVGIASRVLDVFREGRGNEVRAVRGQDRFGWECFGELFEESTFQGG